MLQDDLPGLLVQMRGHQRVVPAAAVDVGIGLQRRMHASLQLGKCFRTVVRFHACSSTIVMPNTHDRHIGSLNALLDLRTGLDALE